MNILRGRFKNIRMTNSTKEYMEKPYLIIFSYSLSLVLQSFHFRYMTEASTLAGENVLGSLSREMILRRIVRTFCVGFHLSDGSSPLCGSSTGGWRIEMQTSPFWRKEDDFVILPKNCLHNDLIVMPRSDSSLRYRSTRLQDIEER